MEHLSVRDTANILGVSDDTVRRLVDDKTITGERVGSRIQIEGPSVVGYMQDRAQDMQEYREHSSLRNNLRGLITKITSDKVMTQVEMMCGPFRIVSLISTEAATELGLEVGTIAVANMKATNVSISR
ncbi:TOBE domain-containing protein [Gleimia hominis]|uniref:TOBE domain-containing protein n=1 Tax=Gleimia hominis TaxID=595468 RepID=A0ABU3IAG1_9ACTO|nr:TOBE domain-containing protein [Gleimia hominis]MDT3767365.1 TOBE domain-containing protein [Gleimia hominis]